MSARSTPAWRKTASTAVSEPARAAVCDPAALLPALERPLFIARIGFSRASRRASRANLRGLPNDSRYIKTRSVLGVVLPPLEQIVGRDVRLVSDRDEGRDADASRLCPFEQRQPECPGLRGEADAPGGECPRGERRVHRHGRRRDAQAVRPDEARAVRAHECEQLFLARATLRSGLGEPGRDHAERARAAPQRRLGGVEDAVARQADHARSIGSGMSSIAV